MFCQAILICTAWIQELLWQKPKTHCENPTGSHWILQVWSGPSGGAGAAESCGAGNATGRRKIHEISWSRFAMLSFIIEVHLTYSVLAFYHGGYFEL